MRKKKEGLLLVLLLCLCFMFSMAGCDLDDDEETSKTVAEVTSGKSYHEDDTWVIYWYLCGSDLETDGGAATDDLNELLSVELPENVTVVIETGGAKQWQNDTVKAKELGRYVYNSDGFEKVDKKPIASMGKADTFADFLKFCNKNYDADHKMIVFWNHGGGSLSGVEFDERYNYDSLSLAEINKALKKTSKKKEYDIIGFDTCLMASLETANAIEKYADYMVASEETEPGSGWDYEAWVGALASNTGITAPQLGKEICDSFMESCSWIAADDTATLSVVDLSKIPALVKNLDAMGLELLATSVGDVSTLTDISRVSGKIENYGGNTRSTGYTNMVDLSDLASKNKKIATSTFSSVKDCIKDAVVYNRSGDYKAHSNGISVYFPLDSDADNLKSYDKVSISRPYNFLLKYLVSGKLPSGTEQMFKEELDKMDEEIEEPDTNAAEELKDFDGKMKLSIDKKNVLTLKISPKQMNSIKSVTFGIYMYLDEESDDNICLGFDNNINMDWENGVFKDNFQGNWFTINKCLCYAELIYEGEDYNLYSIPVKVNSKKYYLVGTYNYTSDSYKILGIKKEIDEDTGMADKNLMELKKGDVIEPILSAYGDGLSDDGEEICVDKFKYTGKEIRFNEDELPASDYGYCFCVEDIHGNYYISDFSIITLDEDGYITPYL